MADAEPGAQVVRRQRVAAYVLCVRDARVLLSRLSARTPRPGLWTLPGGGLEHGEDPRAGAHREAVEETALEVRVGGVLDVVSTHFTGRSPTGVLEDFHGISVLFEGTTQDRRTPEVLDVGGTSDAAAWVALDDVVRAADAPGAFATVGTVGTTELVHRALAAARRRAPDVR